MKFAEQSFLIAGIVAIPILIIFYIVTAQGRYQKLEQFVASKLLDRLTVSYSKVKHNTKIALVIAGIVFLLFTLSRPQWGVDWQEAKGRGVDIMIALDTSQSMLAKDISPNRLEKAKLQILDLVNELEGDRVGLVAFAGQAFLLCPLTLDYDAFRQTLETVDTEIIPVPGTDIATAINESVAAFAKDENFKIVVLITDGEDLEEKGIKRAKKAADNNVKIYTVGVGSEQGVTIPDPTRPGADLVGPDGKVVRTKLDSKTLARIAGVTNGFYAPLGVTGRGLEQVYQQGLASIPKKEREARLRQTPIERYQWPLSVAIILLVIETLTSTRKRITSARKAPTQSLAAIILLTFIFLLTTKNANASGYKGHQHFKAGNYNDAIEQYEKAVKKKPDDPVLHYNLGATYYRLNDFDKAAKALQGSLDKALNEDNLKLQEKAFYNLGNSQFRMGEDVIEHGSEKTIELWEDCIKNYESTLELNPKNDRAQHNLEIVKKRLEKLKNPPQQQQQGDEGQEGEPKESEESQQQEGQQQNQQSGEQQNSEEGEQQNQQGSSQDEKQNGEEQNIGEKEDTEEKEKKQGSSKPEDEKEEGTEERFNREEIEEKESEQDTEKETAKQTERVSILMTPEEAQQLLQSLRSREKKLSATAEKGKRQSNKKTGSQKTW